MLFDLRRISEHRTILTEKKLESIYKSLMEDLNTFVSQQYVKYADEEGRLFVSYLDSQNAKAKFLEEVSKQVGSISPELKNEIDSLVDETYKRSYEGMLKAVKKTTEIRAFENVVKDIAVNPNVLKRAVDNNISKLTLPYVMEKHRNEIVYQIQRELTTGLMQGDRYEDMAKRISSRVGVSQSKARNIVRTESHRNIEGGFMDCAERIQKGCEGTGLVYAVTWRTRGDERVRPQVRRKTKKGWKTSFSRNGANHMKMEGVTIKVGDLFDLGNGVKTKAPSHSGSAANDCNCRCTLEYNVMTLEEFAKASGQKIEKVIAENTKPSENDIFKVEDVNTEFLENITDYDVSTTPRRRKLARQTLDELGLEDIPVSVRAINPHGYCLMNFNSSDTAVHKYVLQSTDSRTDIYKIKTMFHEAYHAKAHGGLNDARKIGMKAWTDIEEVFAESSSHYIMKRAGFTETLAPSYADKFVKILPRMKQLDEFKDFDTVYDFGKYGWTNRMTDQKAVWGNTYNHVMQVDFDWKKYVKENYIDYIDKNIDDVFKKMFENCPNLRYAKEQMLGEYESAKKKLDNSAKLTGNEEMVITSLVASVMMKVGIK